MRAVAVFPGTREVKLIEQDEPAITGPTDVKVRILEVGICGTDKEICAFEYGTPPAGSDYLVLGHEALGEVVEVGPAVEGLRAGDLVVPMVRRPCADPSCRACRAARADFCYTGAFTERGIKERHGFMAEVVVEEENYLCPVPQTLRDIAVLVEPLTIAEKARLQATEIQQRLPWFAPTTRRAGGEAPGTAVVLGAGAVGLLGAMMLRLAGFETYVYDRAGAPSPKSDLVQAIGATHISAEDPRESFGHLIGRVDYVYEAVGSAELALRAMQALGPNGLFICTGVPALTGTHELDANALLRNMVLGNQVLMGTVNAGRDAFEAAIRDLATCSTRWPAQVRALITGRYPLEAHRDLLLGRAGGIKNVLAVAGAAGGGTA
jgi:threonine dehydrogenase-like Zn-dependent dehydrogenase